MSAMKKRGPHQWEARVREKRHYLPSYFFYDEDRVRFR